MPAGYYEYAYFCPGLCPSSGSIPDLFSAVVGRLRAYPGLAVAFGDSASTPKFWGDLAPASVAMPFLVYSEVVGVPGDYSSNRTYIEKGTFQTSIIAAGKRTARDLSRSVAEALDNAPLSFSDGTLMRLQHSNWYSQPNPDEGSGVIVAYQRTVEFIYMVHRIT